MHNTRNITVILYYNYVIYYISLYCDIIIHKCFKVTFTYFKLTVLHIELNKNKI